MKIFGMGGFELVIILIVILLIFGPKNLPKLGNALGKTVSNLRSGMNEGKKKKDEEAEGEPAEAPETPEEPVAARPAEIEGEVEVTQPDAVEPEADDVVEAGVADNPQPAADEPEPEGVEQEATADAVPAPKKVRRVVKKKVADSADVEV